MTHTRLITAVAALIPLCLASPAAAQNPDSPVRPVKQQGAIPTGRAVAVAAPSAPAPSRSGEAVLRIGVTAVPGAPSASVGAPVPSRTDRAGPAATGSVHRFGGPTAALDGLVPTLHSPALSIRAGDEWLPQALWKLRNGAKGMRPDDPRTPAADGPRRKEADGGMQRR